MADSIPQSNDSLATGNGASTEFDRFSDNYEDLLNQNIAITGETGGYFAAYKANFVADRIRPKADCKILDYGCGVGLLSQSLKKRLPEARIDGIDVSQASLAQAPAELRAQGVFTSSAKDLRGPYDVVLLANVLHDIVPESRQNAVSNIAGMLHSRGKLVVFEHNPLNPVTRWAVEHCQFDENVVLLPASESAAYVHSAGLQRIQIYYTVFFPRWLKWLRQMEPALGWCPIGAQYAVVGSAE